MHFKTTPKTPLYFNNLAVIICFITGISACNKKVDDIAPDFEHLSRAQSFINQGQLSSARIELMNALQKNSANPETYALKAELYVALGIYDKAAEQLSKSAALEGDNSIESQLKIHHLYLMSGHIENFEELSNISTKNKQQEYEKSILLGIAYFLKNDSDKANELFIEVIENSNNNPLISRAYYEMAKILKQKNNLPEAVKLIDKSLEIDPDDVDALLFKGILSLSMEEFAIAEEYFTQALLALKELDVMTAKKYVTLSGLVESISSQGRPEQALQYSNILAQSRPGKLKSSYESAINALTDREFEKARTKLEDVLTLAPNHSNSNLIIGLLDLEKGELESAEKHLSLALAGNIVSDKIRKALILTRLRLKQYEQANTLINDGLKDNPGNPDYLTFQGSIQTIQKDYKEAEESFLAALNSNEAYFPAISELALLYSRSNEYKKAEHYFKLATGTQPDNIELMLLRARNAIEANKISEFKTELEKLSKQKPESITPYLIFASIYLQQNELNLAEKNIKLAESIDPNHPLLPNLISNTKLAQSYLYVSKGDLTEAIKLLNEATKVQPKNINAHVIKASLLAKQGHTSEAQKITDQLKSDPNTRSIGLELEGNIWAQQAQFKKASEAYHQVWSANKNAKLGIKLFKINMEYLEFQEASKHLVDWVQSEPNNYAAINALAIINNEHGNYEEATKLYERSLEIKKDNPLILNNLAYSYFKTNNPKALETAHKAYKLAPNYAAVSDTYGWILLKNNQLDKALPILAKAAKKAPKQKEILQHYSEALTKAGKTEEANKILSKITKL